MMFGSERSIEDNLEDRQDTLAFPKEETLAQQRYEQNEDVVGRKDFDEEEKFIDDDDSSGEKLEVFVSLKECKRYSICDSLDTNDPLQAYKRH